MDSMTPQHERWTEFYNKLGEAVTRHGCRHGTEQSRGILGAMGFAEEQIGASLFALADAGGHCDCEILMNCLGGHVKYRPPNKCALCDAPIKSRMTVAGREPCNGDIVWFICDECGERYSDELRRVATLRQTKKRLLDKYATKQPTEFTQYDAFVNLPGDDVMHPDADGDALCSIDTVELMSGIADLRVLIPKGAPIDGEKAAILLKKMAEWIGGEESFKRRRGSIPEDELPPGGEVSF